MTYTYDVTDNIGKVRLLIGDQDITPTTDAQFTDEELQVFLGLAGGELYLGAAYALESWAATETGVMDSERIGDYQYTRGAVSKKLTLAKQYRSTVSSTPASAWSEMDLASVGELPLT